MCLYRWKAKSRFSWYTFRLPAAESLWTPWLLC
uniref:Uncharacterized protein n=1 Tax=Anguilla anguilla TaxID=7936 RepID=A0A0E9VYB8_ANGAN